MATAVLGDAVASNWRRWSLIAPDPEASQIEDVADQPLHALRVALDRLEHRRSCSAVGRDAGSSSSPALVRTTVRGVRSSWAIVDSRSVRSRSSFLSGAASRRPAPLSLSCSPRRVSDVAGASASAACDADEPQARRARRAVLGDARAAGRRPAPRIAPRARRPSSRPGPSPGRRERAAAVRARWTWPHGRRIGATSSARPRRREPPMLRRGRTSTWSPARRSSSAVPSGLSAHDPAALGSPSPAGRQRGVRAPSARDRHPPADQRRSGSSYDAEAGPVGDASRAAERRPPRGRRAVRLAISSSQVDAGEWELRAGRRRMGHLMWRDGVPARWSPSLAGRPGRVETTLWPTLRRPAT